MLQGASTMTPNDEHSYRTPCSARPPVSRAALTWIERRSPCQIGLTGSLRRYNHREERCMYFRLAYFLLLSLGVSSGQQTSSVLIVRSIKIKLVSTRSQPTTPIGIDALLK